GRVQAPQTGYRRIIIILVELRIKVERPVPRPVAGEDDPAVRKVTWRNIVKTRGLIRDFRDRIGAVGQSGDFVKLPEKGARVGGIARRADHHAEQGARAVPMQQWLAHGDAVRVLRASGAVTQ